MGEFGDKFRKAREKKEISLDAVSNVTKISARMLQAIEEEHFDQLPGGVFNKGFIRAYAKHLGMDAEEAVTDYLACLRQAQIDAHEVWEPATVPTRETRTASPEKPVPGKPFNEPIKTVVKPRPSLQVEELPELQLPRAEHVRPPRPDFAGRSSAEIPWRILAIAAVVVILAAILWIRRSHPRTAAASSAPAKAEQAAVVPASPPPSIPVKVAAASVPANSPSTATAPSASTPNAPTVHPSASATVTSPQPNREESDVTTRTFQKPVSSTSAQSQTALRLVIRATETSWVSLVADGQTVNRETLIAPAHASVRASREIVARIGNAAGVTFIWNGQEIPANGAEGEVKTFVFDANGMRVVSSLSAPTQN